MDLALLLKPNARGVVNRARVMKLAREGKLEGRVDFQYDDMTGFTSGAVWLPVTLVPRGEPRISRAGVFVVDPEDFASDTGKAYVSESSRGEHAGDCRRLYLRVHSALRYEFRLAARPGPGVARADLKVPDLSEEEWYALEFAEVAWLPSAPTGMTGAVDRLISLGLVERWLGKLEQSVGDRWTTVQVVRVTGDGAVALARRKWFLEKRPPGRGGVRGTGGGEVR
jgi:hypothetical protein